MSPEREADIREALAACLNGGRGFKYGAMEFDSAEKVSEELAKTATLSAERKPGPHTTSLWSVFVDGEGAEADLSIMVCYTGNGPTSEAHARFIAVAPWAVDALLTALDAERKAHAEALHAIRLTLEALGDAELASTLHVLGGLPKEADPYVVRRARETVARADALEAKLTDAEARLAALLSAAYGFEKIARNVYDGPQRAALRRLLPQYQTAGMASEKGGAK